MGRRKKQAVAEASAPSAVVVEEAPAKKGSFFKKLLFVGVLAGVGFAVFKLRQSSM